MFILLLLEAVTVFGFICGIFFLLGPVAAGFSIKSGFNAGMTLLVCAVAANLGLGLVCSDYHLTADRAAVLTFDEKDKTELRVEESPGVSYTAAARIVTDKDGMHFLAIKRDPGTISEIECIAEHLLPICFSCEGRYFITKGAEWQEDRVLISKNARFEPADDCGVCSFVRSQNTVLRSLARTLASFI